MLAALGRHLDALWCYRSALECSPNNAGIWTNLGNALTHLKHLQGAVAAHQRAIDLSGGSPLLFHNLGTALAEARRHGEAIVAFTRALERDANYHTARWDRGLNFLAIGNYKKGWSDYETRLLTGQVPKRKVSGVRWDGRPYEGSRLLLLCEQGFGDTLWVLRYLSLVKALGGELIVETKPELAPLISSMGVADKIVIQGQTLPEAEFHLHLCSLPGIFVGTSSSIPATPYLSASTDRIAHFRRFIPASANKLKIGIVWSGSTTFRRNGDRAQSLMRFLQAFAMPGVQLYSLQKGPPEEELHTLPVGVPIIDLAPHLKDFLDTAAAISHLDLVIMTDSAVAHLAGAMGKPIWVLLGHVAHWLWMFDRSDSPWYTSLKLYRPRADGDWNHVFDSSSVDLMRMLQARVH